MEQYVIKNNKRLRCGYTTEAARQRRHRERPPWFWRRICSEDKIVLITPKASAELDCGTAGNAGRRRAAPSGKTAATPGCDRRILFLCEGCEAAEPGITLDGGTGVGRVTSADCPARSERRRSTLSPGR
jgi:cobalamin biosynthesis protein CbiD